MWTGKGYLIILHLDSCCGLEVGALASAISLSNLVPPHWSESNLAINFPVASHSLQNKIPATGKLQRLFVCVFLQVHVLSCFHILWREFPAFYCYVRPNSTSSPKLTSLCIRSPCSLTQIHLDNFHSSFRTPSKTEHYHLPLVFSHRKLFGLFLPAPSLFFYNSHFTVLHSFIFWYVHSPLKSEGKSFTFEIHKFQTRGQHVVEVLINVWRVYKMSFGSAVLLLNILKDFQSRS